jgi:hypothetical protein
MAERYDEHFWRNGHSSRPLVAATLISTDLVLSLADHGGGTSVQHRSEVIDSRLFRLKNIALCTNSLRHLAMHADMVIDEEQRLPPLFARHV